MSTGSRGMHVAVPIKQELKFEEVRAIALKITGLIINANPERFTIELLKKKRRGKIFIDVNRNSRAQTSVSPYSLRAIDGAPIACPLDWNELKDFNPQKYNLKNIFARLRKKGDAWKDFFKSPGDLERALKKIDNA
jgi:bifunctional non-homologous end joining protein LigD